MPRPDTSVEICIHTDQHGHAMRHEQTEERMKTRVIRPRLELGPPACNRVTLSVNDGLVGYIIGVRECSLEGNKLEPRFGSNCKFEKCAFFILM